MPGVPTSASTMGRGTVGGVSSAAPNGIGVTWGVKTGDGGSGSTNTNHQWCLYRRHSFIERKDTKQKAT
jgi:hypothetical protein